AGIELIEKRAALRPVLSALNHGLTVALLLDQNASRREGIFVTFFGRSASTSKSLAVLAVRTQAPIVPIFIYRERLHEHRVVIHPSAQTRRLIPSRPSPSSRSAAPPRPRPRSSPRRINGSGSTIAGGRGRHLWRRRGYDPAFCLHGADSAAGPGRRDRHRIVPC